MAQDYNEAEVLRSLAQGNENAFRQIYDRYSLTVYRVARRYFQSAKLEEDLVQEIFSTIWLKRTEFMGVRHFSSYLYAMVKNLALQYLRELAKEEMAKREFANHSLITDNSIDKYILEKEYDKLVQQAVEQLPPQRKLVFQLAKVEGLSHQMIASRLNLSKHTVSNHMVLALKFIRNRLEHHILFFICLVLSFAHHLLLS